MTTVTSLSCHQSSASCHQSSSHQLSSCHQSSPCHHRVINCHHHHHPFPPLGQTCSPVSTCDFTPSPPGALEDRLRSQLRVTLPVKWQSQDGLPPEPKPNRHCGPGTPQVCPTVLEPMGALLQAGRQPGEQVEGHTPPPVAHLNAERWTHGHPLLPPAQAQGLRQGPFLSLLPRLWIK